MIELHENMSHNIKTSIAKLLGVRRNVANSPGASSSEGGGVGLGGPLCCEASSMRARLGNTRRSASGQHTPQRAPATAAHKRGPLAREDQPHARNAGACQVSTTWRGLS